MATASGLPTPTQSYYVDCANGNDAASGTAPTAAWASLGRTSQASLQPGEALLLERGCTWVGPLAVGWSGTATQPILIGAYGSGDPPRIQNASRQVDVTGSYVIVDGLLLQAEPERRDPGCQNQPVGSRIGVLFEGGAHDNVVQNSTFIHLSVGIEVARGAHHNSISFNRLTDVNIMFTLTPRTRNDDDDAGAQAVLLEGDSNDVGYNTITGSLACSYDYGTDGAAVEVFGGQNNVIHHNNASANDIFTELGNARSANNVYSYNVNVGTNILTTRGGGRWGPVTGTKLYNNTFYSTGVGSINCYQCGPNILTLKNNIVWTDGSAILWADAPFDEGYNVYWSAQGQPYNRVPISSTSQVVDPRFVDSASGDLRLQPSSPVAWAGALEQLNPDAMARLAQTADQTPSP